MTLHLYLARRFLRAFLTVFGAFALFVMLVELVEQARQFADEAPFPEVMRLALLRTPDSLSQFLPLILIIATISMCLAMSRSSELVAIRAAGRSGVMALVGPLIVAALLGAAAVSMGNPIVAATAKRYQDLKQHYRSGGTASFSVGPEGLWLRQGGAGGQTVIHARRASPDGRVLQETTFIDFAPAGGPVRRIHAISATLGAGVWTLRNAKVWPLSRLGNPEESAVLHPRLDVPTSLTHEDLLENFGTPKTVPIWQMPDFIARLSEAGLSARRYVVSLHAELARPLFLLAMMVLGAAFTMRPVRLGGTAYRVLAAVLIGFALHYARNFARILGENGQLDPFLAAWVPPLAALLFAFGLLLRAEEG